MQEQQPVVEAPAKPKRGRRRSNKQQEQPLLKPAAKPVVEKKKRGLLFYFKLLMFFVVIAAYFVWILFPYKTQIYHAVGLGARSSDSHFFEHYHHEAKHVEL